MRILDEFYRKNSQKKPPTVVHFKRNTRQKTKPKNTWERAWESSFNSVKRAYESAKKFVAAKTKAVSTIVIDKTLIPLYNYFYPPPPPKKAREEEAEEMFANQSSSFHKQHMH